MGSVALTFPAFSAIGTGGAARFRRNLVLFLVASGERSRGLEAQEPSLLVAAYFSRREAIKRLLAARLGNQDEAEEVTQELFLKVSRVADEDNVRNPAAYLFRMAMNLARDHRRERQRARKRDADWVSTRHIMAGTEAIADIPSAEASYNAKQRLAVLKQAIDELTPLCRRVFLMHRIDELPHEEIARRLGISRSAVEKHMHKAIKHLIERVERD